MGLRSRTRSDPSYNIGGLSALGGLAARRRQNTQARTPTLPLRYGSGLLEVEGALSGVAEDEDGFAVDFGEGTGAGRESGEEFFVGEGLDRGWFGVGRQGLGRELRGRFDDGWFCGEVDEEGGEENCGGDLEAADKAAGVAPAGEGAKGDLERGGIVRFETLIEEEVIEELRVFIVFHGAGAGGVV